MTCATSAQREDDGDDMGTFALNVLTDCVAWLAACTAGTKVQP